VDSFGISWQRPVAKQPVKTLRSLTNKQYGAFAEQRILLNEQFRLSPCLGYIKKRAVACRWTPMMTWEYYKETGAANMRMWQRRPRGQARCLSWRNIWTQAVRSSMDSAGYSQASLPPVRLNSAVEWLAFLISTRKVQGSNLSSETVLVEFQPLQGSVWRVTYYFPRKFPSTSFPTHHSHPYSH
jgi:hypothetical protein